MLNEKTETFNTFSLKKVEEKQKDLDINKNQSASPIQQLEKVLKQLPQELIGSTTKINDLLTNMNTLISDSPLTNMLQNIEQVMKKNEEKMKTKWKLIELEDEHIIYLELEHVLRDDITLEIADHIVTIKMNKKASDSREKETITHSIALPYKIEATAVKAYYSPSLIDIHIPKKKTYTISLLDRTPKELQK